MIEEQRSKLIISVIGSGSATVEAASAAEQVGAELARRGVTVVCGGLGGVMEAVCKGAKSAGGTTISILPGVDPQDANPYVDYALPTGMGHARNTLVVKAGRAVVAVSGAFGTLSEIAFALSENIPVVGLGTWHLTRPDGLEDTAVIRANDPVDAVEKAIAAALSRVAST